MSATRKKVIVREFGGELHRGYFPASGLGVNPKAELLLPDGCVTDFSFSSVKHIAYVRDFNFADACDPEQMGRRTFSSRPRGGGVWVGLHFTDDDSLEGLLHNGMSMLDGLLLDSGLFLDPPDKRGNTQRLFIPRSALKAFEVLGIAGSTSRSARPGSAAPRRQGDLFDAQAEPSGTDES